MIDTLRLRLNDYELTKDNNFTFEGSTFKTNGELVTSFYLTDIENEKIYGKKGYCNNDNYQLSILNDYSERNNLIMQISLPKYYTKSHNLYSLNYEQTKDVFHQLNNDLKKDGIKTNIENSTIIRLDSFKNIETERNFNSYKDIFKIMKLSRTNDIDYGSSILKKNSQKQICIYDKIEEMKHNKTYQFSHISTPENVIRFENRLIKKRKILSELKFNDTKTLITKDGFNSVIDNYYNTMEKTIFNQETIKDFTYYSNNEIMNELTYFKEKYGRNYVNIWVSFKGYETIKNHLNINNFFEVIQEIEKNNKNIVYNKKSKFKELLSKFNIDSTMMKFNEKEQITSIDLYNELKNKMFKKVS